MLCLLWLGVHGKAFLSKQWKMTLPPVVCRLPLPEVAVLPSLLVEEVVYTFLCIAGKMSWESLMDYWRWIWANPAHFVWNGLKSTHMTSFLCQSSGVVASHDGKQHQPIQWDLEDDFCVSWHYLSSSLYRKTHINCKWGVDF